MTPELKKNTLKVILFLLAASALAVAIMAFFDFFDYTVITGTLLGFFGAALNFLFLALAVSKSVDKDEKGAKNFVQATYTGRFLFMAIVIVAGIKLPYFNGYATVIPFVLVRPVIMFIGLLSRKKTNIVEKVEQTGGTDA
jgi:uncharacterized membrane-anchored protein